MMISRENRATMTASSIEQRQTIRSAWCGTLPPIENAILGESAIHSRGARSISCGEHPSPADKAEPNDDPANSVIQPRFLQRPQGQHDDLAPILAPTSSRLRSASLTCLPNGPASTAWTSSTVTHSNQVSNDDGLRCRAMESDAVAHYRCAGLSGAAGAHYRRLRPRFDEGPLRARFTAGFIDIPECGRQPRPRPARIACGRRPIQQRQDAFVRCCRVF